MTSVPADLLVTNVTIAAPSTGWVPTAGWLACRDGRITGFGRIGDIAPRAVKAIDGEGGLVLPGLRNGHTHGSEILARGVADGLELADWLAEVWPRLDALTPEQMAIAVRFGALLSIRCGITSMVDHMRRNPMSDEVIEAAAAAYESVGMRALISVMVRDRAGANHRSVGAGHLGAPEPAHRQLARIAAAAQRLASDRIGIGVGPSASVRCTDEMLSGVASLSRDSGLPIHVHAAESAAEVADERRDFGMTSFERMERLGMLGRRTACAHCVWLEPRDIEILAGTGSVVVHNPVSNLRLKSGIADLPGLRAGGVEVAIGTDGAASNDGVDVWEALKFAALLPRRNAGTAAMPGSIALLDMVTTSGAAALGGRGVPFEVGSPADFCLYPAAEAPIGNDDSFAAALVLSVPRRPSHVVIGGALVLEQGAFLHVDEAETARQARHLARELMA
ncbi:MAG: amidohydrolase [Xanthobacteraceae bacterium]|nr:amidohydrolase [Xanthobacteraceae bacterium]